MVVILKRTHLILMSKQSRQITFAARLHIIAAKQLNEERWAQQHFILKGMYILHAIRLLQLSLHFFEFRYAGYFSDYICVFAS
jgi:hypothetical protein